MLRPWRRGGHRDPGADTVLSIPPTSAPTETAGDFGVQKGIPHHFPKEKGAAAHQGAGQPHHLGSEVLDGQSLATMMSMVKLMVAMRTPRMKRKYQSSPTRKSCRFTHSKHPRSLLRAVGQGLQLCSDTSTLSSSFSSFSPRAPPGRGRSIPGTFLGTAPAFF